MTSNWVGASTRTRILVIVDRPADVPAAERSGALVALAPEGEQTDQTVDGALSLLWLTAFDAHAPLPAGEEGATVMLSAAPERLFSRYDYAALSRFADICRAAGRPFGFAGALEAPDVPRLTPLGPALLAVENPARRLDGGLDEEALGALVASARTAASIPHHPAPDRVFIRDFVQEMEIGAYRSEHGRRQRVRFGIEVELAPVRAPRGMADIYSYDRMMDAVRALASRAPEPFVETLAEDLAADILADARVQAVTVRVEKLDLGPAAAGVEIRRTRG